MKEFWSDRIRSLTPYTPGEQPKGRKFIKLNTNENPYPPSPKALAAIQANADASLRLYSDPDAADLRAAIAKTYSVKPEQVFVGNGSDEVLAFAFQAFYSEGAEIVFPDITYSFYPVYANMFGICYRTVPLKDDFTVPVDALCGGNDGVVIANPNAPTGMELPQSEIRRILEANPNVVVIVDEAYVDFGGESVLPLIEEYPNLLVVQTFSKSRALAGLRVGFAFGCENLIQALNCVKNSINSYTLDRLARRRLWRTRSISTSGVPKLWPPVSGQRRNCASRALRSIPPKPTSSLSHTRSFRPKSCLPVCGRRGSWCATLPSPVLIIACASASVLTRKWMRS